jgi:hypothetical protein
VTTIPLNLQGKNYSQLAGLGFESIQSDSASQSDNYRDVPIVGGYVNALLLGGYKGGSDQDDYFKIKSLSATTRTTVPEPSTMLLLLTGAGGIVGWRSRRVKGALGPIAHT